MANTYQWDQIETYRLTQRALEGYLAQVFGSFDFFIYVRIMFSAGYVR